VDPYRLGQLLAGRIAPAGALESVHVYRGIPDSKRDPKGYGAASRQRAAHEAAGYGIVAYHMRPLRYPQGWPRVKAQEKGVDVELAVDYVSMAARGDYDTAVLFSTDSDLRPALEAVAALRKPGHAYPCCEVAAWRNPAPSVFSPRLAIRAASVWCHWLSVADFQAVADPSNYAASS